MVAAAHFEIVDEEFPLRDLQNFFFLLSGDLNRIVSFIFSFLYSLAVLKSPKWDKTGPRWNINSVCGSC